MGHVYVLGAVKPWVRDAAQEVGDRFDIGSILGVGVRPNLSDHPLGLATDFMVGSDRAKGDAVAAYVIANAARLNVKYVIWYQRIWENGSWSNMENRGSDTANHKEHVHVSYNATGAYSPNGATEPQSNTGSASGLASLVHNVTSAQTWVRVLEFTAAIVIIGLIVYSMAGKVALGA